MTEPIQSTATAGVSLVTLAVAMFGPAAGPYVVILLGSVGGSLWALAGVKKMTRKQGAGMMLRCILTALALTAILAAIVAPWLKITDVKEVYVAVAFVIGAFGNKWQEVFESLKQRFIALISISGGPKP